MAAFAFPNIDPVAFRIGPLAVRWYGLAYMTAFLAAWWILKRLDEAGVYWREPVRILQLWDGGMSFHGGLVGLLLAGAWVARRYHVPFLRLTDVGAIAAPIGLFWAGSRTSSTTSCGDA